MNFNSKIVFQPSFHENLEVTLTNDSISLELIPRLLPISHLESKEKLNVQEYKQLKEYRIKNEEFEKRRWKVNTSVTLEELKSIFSLLVDIANNKEVDNRAVLDGIIVNCQLVTESISTNFRFHSPERSMRSYELAKQIIELCFSKFGSQKVIDAVEQIESYFGFQSPWKITNTSPFTCRIYGRLSVYEKEGIETFFETIPMNQKLFIDLLNFEGMGTILYDCFRKLDSNYTDIDWLVKKENEWVINQLLEIGIDENRIIKN